MKYRNLLLHLQSLTEQELDHPVIIYNDYTGETEDINEVRFAVDPQMQEQTLLVYEGSKFCGVL